MEAELLQRRLRVVGRRLLAVRTLGGLGWGVVAAVGVVFVAVWLDLLWELPPGVRAATLAAAAGVGLVLLAALAWQARRRAAPLAVAHQLDLVGGAGGRIRTGVDLIAAGRESPLTAGLAVLAVKDASEIASKVPAGRVGPAKTAAWPFAGLALLAAVVGVLYAVAPRLVETEWRRFTHLYADQPAFSSVEFAVEPGDTQIVFGKPLEVKATTAGAAVDRLSLVIEPADRAGEEVLPMFAEPGGAWRATVANLTADAKYHVRAHAGRSPRYTVRVLTVPKIEGVRFRVTPPVYTNRPPYEGPLPKGGLAGLPGTKVQVWAASNRPLKGGTVRFTPPGTEPAALVTGSTATEATGTFEIRTAGQGQLKVTDAAGQESADTFTFPVALLTDERPTVRLLDPREVSIATPTATIPVVIAAEDDYGVSRVQLFRSLNDSRALPLDVPVKTPFPPRVYEVVHLPLSAYGLEPGDEIKLFARAEDTDPAGAKGAESGVVVVRIIAQEEFERMLQAREGLELMMSKYQQARRRMEAVANEAERLQKKREERKQPNEAEDKKDLQELAKKARDEAKAIREAMKKDLGYDLDKALTPQLEKLSRELEEQAKALEKLAGQKTLSPDEVKKALEKMAKSLDREKQEFDKSALAALERLKQVMPLMQKAEEFKSLARRQRDLETRLRPLKDQENVTDPAARARMKDLRAEQEELRADLAKLLDDIEEHADALPDDPELKELRDTAKEFAGELRKSGAAEAMSAAEAGLGDHSGKKGHSSADTAAGILEEFVKKCNGMGGLPGQCKAALKFQPTLSQCLGGTCEQLLAQMGFGQSEGDGDGTGMGTGRGSSSRRGNNNMGMYGSLPGISDSTGMGSFSRGGGPNRPGGRGDGGGPGSPTQANGSKQPGAAGAGEAAIPAPYRKRVSEYFQRVTDETGGK